MDVFKYEPADLEVPAFRLLRLIKGREVDIECELFQAWLYEDCATIPYEALSYTWGGTEMTKYIKIEGKRFGITENLYWALWHLRSQDTDRILWIDAVCINQSNNEERGQHVRQMGNIYSQADRVIIWLGPATFATDVIMDSLMQLQKECLNHAHNDWKPSDGRWVNLWLAVNTILRRQHLDLERLQRRGVELLLERPWFQRVWILQEVANATTAVVCCGTKSVLARIFALAPLLTGVQPNPHSQAVLDIMPGLSKDSWWSQKRDLYTLLVKFNGCKASDPRDMIYALLGITSDVCDSNHLRADYTKDTQQVIRDVSLFLFGQTNLDYRTMSEFLCNITSLNIEYISRVAKWESAREVADFLERRGGEVKITEAVVEAAARNWKSGKEVIAFLLERRGGEFKITEDVLKAAAGNWESGTEVIVLLLEERGGEVKITEDVLKAAAGNWDSGTEVVACLLERRGDEVKITKDVVEAASTNSKSGKGVMALLQRHEALQGH
ncbi:heterokaryon incompatibility protein-domain-containing protein [Tricladium varicosporioides]|nr:heterokaryon incompatibility protein-domain-containing protein [Hymenoscyphus varicosporioides]